MDLTTNTHKLKDVPFFDSVSDTELTTLNQGSKIIKVKKSKHVYHVGSSKDYVYVVLSGAIKIGRLTVKDKVLIKDIVYDGDLFGENVFVDAGNRTEFAEALKESVVLCIPIKAFKDLALSNGAVTLRLTNLIVSRIQNLENRTQNFVFLKAKQRIANFLRSTASARGIRIGLDELLINHGMSHKEIAYLTDTSRQTVARVLGEFKEENVIHFSSRKPNKILIRDLAALS